VIRDHVNDLFDELRVDAMGSLIGLRKPRPAGKTSSRKKTQRVMLAAHMDQIGFLVSHIDDKGVLRINPVGGVDVRNLFSRRVTVCAAKGDLPAVLTPTGKPTHLATEEERKKIPEISEFYVDLALPAEQVKKTVQIGDMVVLDGPFGEVGDAVVSRCLDNRIGCWAVIRALESLDHHNCEICVAFTVQEEVGLRGAGPAAFGIEPDIGVSCDTTLCCQTPGVADEQRVTEFGGGVGLKVMDGSTIADLKLIEQIEQVARRHKIVCQRCILPGRAAQDGAMIQRSRTGVRTAVFACPVKNIHTVTEMAAKSDLQSYRDLLAAWLGQL
jgi:endoglucanase